MDNVDCIVAGAGVVGLAIARRLARTGMEVVILEREDAHGTGTSSRNSEVIHAGIYYESGSLKARLCVRGRQMLYAYAAEQAVPHRRCGKLIVAISPDQHAALDAIITRAKAAGVTDLRRLTAQEAQEMEPQLHCTAALFSPSTGIVDSHGLMLSLLGDAEAAGAILSLGSLVTGVEVTTGGFIVTTEDRHGGGQFVLASRLFINAAGLHASELAAAIRGLSPRHVPPTRFARGNYFAVSGRPSFSHLIYPVPESGGLGVHLTLDLAGGMRFGPDVDWIDSINHRVNPARRDHFQTEIRKYWPALPADALAPTYCGIRPKLSGPGQHAADFRIDGPELHNVPGLINLFGIESPGLTSCLAIAEEVERRLASAG